MKGYRHGLVYTKFYRIWASMLRRCDSVSQDSYHLYGGRGIAVCDKWKKFLGFKEDMYESYLEHVIEHSEKDTSLDRIDTNGNYEKRNCRWATMKEQQRNRRNSRLLTFNGKTQSMAGWAEERGITYDQLKLRLRRGWPLDKALYTPRLVNQYSFGAPQSQAGGVPGATPALPAQ